MTDTDEERYQEGDIVVFPNEKAYMIMPARSGRVSLYRSMEQYLVMEVERIGYIQTTIRGTEQIFSKNAFSSARVLRPIPVKEE